VTRNPRGKRVPRPLHRRTIRAGGRIHLVQLLVPLYGNDGTPFPPDRYVELRDELTSRFGGLTAYTRAPAQGTWKADAESPTREDIIVYEVMVEHLDVAWWATYRRALETRFEQDELVVRAHRVRRL
jgi:hypothetical protein